MWQRDRLTVFRTRDGHSLPSIPEMTIDMTMVLPLSAAILAHQRGNGRLKVSDALRAMRAKFVAGQFPGCLPVY